MSVRKWCDVIGECEYRVMRTITKALTGVAVVAVALSLAACNATEIAPLETSTATPLASTSSTATATVPATVPVDSGPGDSATGTAVLDANGTPIGYIVAEGDTAWGIERRFGINGLAERYNRYLQPGERLDLVASAP